MAKSTHFSHTALVFHGKQLPEEATVVGYGAIIHSLQIEMPLSILPLLHESFCVGLI